jgi:hypothetical protein
MKRLRLSAADLAASEEHLLAAWAEGRNKWNLPLASDLIITIWMIRKVVKFLLCEMINCKGREHTLVVLMLKVSSIHRRTFGNTSSFDVGTKSCYNWIHTIIHRCQIFTFYS